MAVSDADKRAFLAQNVSPDLMFLWEELNVSLAHQYELSQNYRTIVRFAAIADSRSDARTAFRSDCTLDAAAAEGRAALAGLVAAWQTALDTSESERKLKAEAHALGLPKPLPAKHQRARPRELLEGLWEGWGGGISVEVLRRRSGLVYALTDATQKPHVLD